MSDQRYPKKREMVEGGVTDPTEAHVELRRELEDRAAQSRTMFVRCLFEIQLKGLFRWTHNRFADYLKEVWGMSKSELGRRQQEGAVLGEVVDRLQSDVPKWGRLRPILTDARVSRALARVPTEKVAEVLEEIRASDSTVPMKVAVKRAVDNHVAETVREQKKRPGKKAEVSTRSRVSIIGEGLRNAAGGYDDQQFRNVVYAALNELRDIWKKLK